MLVVNRARVCRCPDRGAPDVVISEAEAEAEVKAEVDVAVVVASLCRHNRQTDLVPLIPSKKLDRE